MKPIPYITSLVWLVFGVVLAFLAVNIAHAQQPTPSDNEVNAIAKQLYCPVCENIPLDVCPTQACAQWRELIREKLIAGWTEDQIKAYFVDQYGDRVLGQPPARGINWLAYLVPPVAILGGVYILYTAFRSWKKPLPADAAPAGMPAGEPAGQALVTSDEYVARLEEELRNR
jgi:cytochrome c-type biogenesis protein CcmH